MQDVRRYIAKETMISFFANSMVNSIVIWAVFGGKTDIPLFRSWGLAIDFIPQLGAITLIGSIVPALLARSRLRSGKIRSTFGAVPIELSAILRNSVVAAICVIVALGLAVTAVLAMVYPGPYGFPEVFAIKSIVGCVVPFIITPRAIGWVIQR